jgi:hypothetical protein
MLYYLLRSLRKYGIYFCYVVLVYNMLDCSVILCSLCLRKKPLCCSLRSPPPLPPFFDNSLLATLAEEANCLRVMLVLKYVGLLCDHVLAPLASEAYSLLAALAKLVSS